MENYWDTDKQVRFCKRFRFIAGVVETHNRKTFHLDNRTFRVKGYNVKDKIMTLLMSIKTRSRYAVICRASIGMGKPIPKKYIAKDLERSVGWVTRVEKVCADWFEGKYPDLVEVISRD